MLAFKQFVSAAEWADLHPILHEVLGWLHYRWPDESMVITRIFDPTVAGESGVHRTSPHRAADIRTSTLADVQIKAIVSRINAFWAYGNPSNPDRQVALYHAVPGGALHLHLQVHDLTHPRPPMATT